MISKLTSRLKMRSRRNSTASKSAEEGDGSKPPPIPSGSTAGPHADTEQQQRHPGWAQGSRASPAQRNVLTGEADGVERLGTSYNRSRHGPTSAAASPVRSHADTSLSDTSGGRDTPPQLVTSTRSGEWHPLRIESPVAPYCSEDGTPTGAGQPLAAAIECRECLRAAVALSKRVFASVGPDASGEITTATSGSEDGTKMARTQLGANDREVLLRAWLDVARVLYQCCTQTERAARSTTTFVFGSPLSSAPQQHTPFKRSNSAASVLSNGSGAGDDTDGMAPTVPQELALIFAACSWDEFCSIGTYLAGLLNTLASDDQQKTNDIVNKYLAGVASPQNRGESGTTPLHTSFLGVLARSKLLFLLATISTPELAEMVACGSSAITPVKQQGEEPGGDSDGGNVQAFTSPSDGSGTPRDPAAGCGGSFGSIALHAQLCDDVADGPFLSTMVGGYASFCTLAASTTRHWLDKTDQGAIEPASMESEVESTAQLIELALSGALLTLKHLFSGAHAVRALMKRLPALPLTLLDALTYFRMAAPARVVVSLLRGSAELTSAILSSIAGVLTSTPQGWETEAQQFVTAIVSRVGMVWKEAGPLSSGDVGSGASHGHLAGLQAAVPHLYLGVVQTDAADGKSQTALNSSFLLPEVPSENYRRSTTAVSRREVERFRVFAQCCDDWAYMTVVLLERLCEVVAADHHLFLVDRACDITPTICTAVLALTELVGRLDELKIPAHVSHVKVKSASLTVLLGRLFADCALISDEVAAGVADPCGLYQGVHADPAATGFSSSTKFGGAVQPLMGKSKRFLKSIASPLTSTIGAFLPAGVQSSLSSGGMGTRKHSSAAAQSITTSQMFSGPSSLTSVGSSVGGVHSNSRLHQHSHQASSEATSPTTSDSVGYLYGWQRGETSSHGNPCSGYYTRRPNSVDQHSPALKFALCDSMTVPMLLQRLPAALELCDVVVPGSTVGATKALKCCEELTKMLNLPTSAACQVPSSLVDELKEVVSWVLATVLVRGSAIKLHPMPLCLELVNALRRAPPQAQENILLILYCAVRRLPDSPTSPIASEFLTIFVTWLHGRIVTACIPGEGAHQGKALPPPPPMAFGVLAALLDYSANTREMLLGEMRILDVIVGSVVSVAVNQRPTATSDVAPVGPVSPTSSAAETPQQRTPRKSQLVSVSGETPTAKTPTKASEHATWTPSHIQALFTAVGEMATVIETDVQQAALMREQLMTTAAVQQQQQQQSGSAPGLFLPRGSPLVSATSSGPGTPRPPSVGFDGADGGHTSAESTPPPENTAMGSVVHSAELNAALNKRRLLDELTKVVGALTDSPGCLIRLGLRTFVRRCHAKPQLRQYGRLVFDEVLERCRSGSKAAVLFLSHSIHPMRKCTRDSSGAVPASDGRRRRLEVLGVAVDALRSEMKRLDECSAELDNPVEYKSAKEYVREALLLVGEALPADYMSTALFKKWRDEAEVVVMPPAEKQTTGQGRRQVDDDASLLQAVEAVVKSVVNETDEARQSPREINSPVGADVGFNMPRKSQLLVDAFCSALLHVPDRHNEQLLVRPGLLFVLPVFLEAQNKDVADQVTAEVLRLLKHTPNVDSPYFVRYLVSRATPMIRKDFLAHFQLGAFLTRVAPTPSSDPATMDFWRSLIAAERYPSGSYLRFMHRSAYLVGLQMPQGSPAFPSDTEGYSVCFAFKVSGGTSQRGHVTIMSMRGPHTEVSLRVKWRTQHKTEHARRSSLLGTSARQPSLWLSVRIHSLATGHGVERDTEVDLFCWDSWCRLRFAHGPPPPPESPNPGSNPGSDEVSLVLNGKSVLTVPVDPHFSISSLSASLQVGHVGPCTNPHTCTTSLDVGVVHIWRGVLSADEVGAFLGMDFRCRAPQYVEVGSLAATIATLRVSALPPTTVGTTGSSLQHFPLASKKDRLVGMYNAKIGSHSAAQPAWGSKHVHSVVDNVVDTWGLPAARVTHVFHTQLPASVISSAEVFISRGGCSVMLEELRQYAAAYNDDPLLLTEVLCTSTTTIAQVISITTQNQLLFPHFYAQLGFHFRGIVGHLLGIVEEEITATSAAPSDDDDSNDHGEDDSDVAEQNDDNPLQWNHKARLRTISENLSQAVGNLLYMLIARDPSASWGANTLINNLHVLEQLLGDWTLWNSLPLDISQTHLRTLAEMFDSATCDFARENGEVARQGQFLERFLHSYLGVIVHSFFAGSNAWSLMSEMIAVVSNFLRCVNYRSECCRIVLSFTQEAVHPGPAQYTHENDSVHAMLPEVVVRTVRNALLEAVLDGVYHHGPSLRGFIDALFGSPETAAVWLATLTSIESHPHTVLTAMQLFGLCLQADAVVQDVFAVQAYTPVKCGEAGCTGLEGLGIVLQHNLRYFANHPPLIHAVLGLVTGCDAVRFVKEVVNRGDYTGLHHAVAACGITNKPLPELLPLLFSLLSAKQRDLVHGVVSHKIAVTQPTMSSVTKKSFCRFRRVVLAVVLLLRWRRNWLHASLASTVSSPYDATVSPTPRLPSSPLELASVSLSLATVRGVLQVLNSCYLGQSYAPPQQWKRHGNDVDERVHRGCFLEDLVALEWRASRVLHPVGQLTVDTTDKGSDMGSIAPTDSPAPTSRDPASPNSGGSGETPRHDRSPPPGPDTSQRSVSQLLKRQGRQAERTGEEPSRCDTSEELDGLLDAAEQVMAAEVDDAVVPPALSDGGLTAASECADTEESTAEAALVRGELLKVVTNTVAGLMVVDGAALGPHLATLGGVLDQSTNPTVSGTGPMTIAGAASMFQPRISDSAAATFVAQLFRFIAGDDHHALQSMTSSRRNASRKKSATELYIGAVAGTIAHYIKEANNQSVHPLMVTNLADALSNIVVGDYTVMGVFVPCWLALVQKVSSVDYDTAARHYVLERAGTCVLHAVSQSLPQTENEMPMVTTLLREVSKLHDQLISVPRYPYLTDYVVLMFSFTFHLLDAPLPNGVSAQGSSPWIHMVLALILKCVAQFQDTPIWGTLIDNEALQDGYRLLAHAPTFRRPEDSADSDLAWAAGFRIWLSNPSNRTQLYRHYTSPLVQKRFDTHKLVKDALLKVSFQYETCLAFSQRKGARSEAVAAFSVKRTAMKQSRINELIHVVDDATIHALQTREYIDSREENVITRIDTAGNCLRVKVAKDEDRQCPRATESMLAAFCDENSSVLGVALPPFVLPVTWGPPVQLATPQTVPRLSQQAVTILHYITSDTIVQVTNAYKVIGIDAVPVLAVLTEVELLLLPDIVIDDAGNITAVAENAASAGEAGVTLESAESLNDVAAAATSDPLSTTKFGLRMGLRGAANLLRGVRKRGMEKAFVHLRDTIMRRQLSASLSHEDFTKHSKHFREYKASAVKSLHTDGDGIFWRHPLYCVTSVHARQFQLNDVALEVHSEFESGIFLAIMDTNLVMSKPERDRLAAAISKWSPHSTLVTQKDTPQMVDACLQQWRRRVISNYDFVTQLNSIAGRNRFDWSQYPVFPWVLADYESNTVNMYDAASFRNLSRPIGAQSDQRVVQLQEKYNQTMELGMEPFHYGTHYSTSAVTLYYNVRQQPYATVSSAFQGKGLDVADRLFHSIQEAWQSSTSTTNADVKELIPEFFSNPGFLLNTNLLRLGTRQDAVELDNVVLPPWAHGSPEKFCAVMRLALESDHCSANLPFWLDLIFGFKQRGPEAVEAVNVFMLASYDGEFQRALRASTNRADREAMTRQVDNFGQTPRQLFKAAIKPRKPRGDDFARLMVMHAASFEPRVVKPEAPLRSSDPAVRTITVREHAVLASFHNSWFIGNDKDFIQWSVEQYTIRRHAKGGRTTAGGRFLGRYGSKMSSVLQLNRVPLAGGSSSHQSGGHAEEQLSGQPDDHVELLGVTHFFPPCASPYTAVKVGYYGTMLWIGAASGSLYVLLLDGARQVYELRYTLAGHTAPVSHIVASAKRGIFISVSGSRIGKNDGPIVWRAWRQRVCFMHRLSHGDLSADAASERISDLCIAERESIVVTVTPRWLYHHAVTGRAIGRSQLPADVADITAVAVANFRDWCGTFLYITGHADGRLSLWLGSLSLDHSEGDFVLISWRAFLGTSGPSGATGGVTPTTASGGGGKTAMSTSAVTTITVLEDRLSVYSGHQNGTVQCLELPPDITPELERKQPMHH